MLEGKKGQGFLETMTVQATSILLVIVALSSLTILFKSDYGCLVPGIGLATTNFWIPSHQFFSQNSTTAPNGFYAILQPKLPGTYIIDEMALYENDKLCWEYSFPEGLPTTWESPAIMNGYVNSNCTKAAWTCAKYDVEVTFKKSSESLTHTEKGYIYTTIEALHTPLYTTTGWRATDYSGEIVQARNNNPIGSFGDDCPAEIDDNMEFPTNVTDLITWSLPNGCDNKVSGVGFAAAYCNGSLGSKKLASGWLTTNLSVHPIFRGHTLFLTGDAGWIDEDDIPRTDGICINDNMYVYVNEQLLAKAGTTGIQSTNNQLDPGEEVLKSCDGCTTSSSEGWCVPPVNLTSSSAFSYSGMNVIHVLVEDYCKSGGETNGGGIKPFSFYFF